MVTVNAAEATATDDVIGSLQAGKVGDIAVFDGSVHADFRAVIDAGPSDVTLVMRGGKVLYGDANIVSAVAGGDAGACDTVDVCSVSKQICLAGEIGKTYPALQTAVSGIYAAFFCGTPDGEPTCVPSRPASVSGSGIYTGAIASGDADGDGIADATDDCPHVFNPIRPMDGGKQADFDGDGVGDACDPCPLDANTTTCKSFDPNDRDGDGVPNASDDCPNVPNPGQADADGDGIGDACDPCPAVANPGGSACPETIYAIKSGAVSPGTVVAVANALVTAKAASGYFLQTKPGDAGYTGSDYSGVYVYGSASAVAVGDRVNVTSATVTNYYGQIELTTPVVAVTASAGEALPDPVLVTSADAATGGARAAKLESVLVTVAGPAVTSVTPPVGAGDTAPTNEFVVDGSLRVDDFLYLVTPFPVVGTTYTSLSGVLVFRDSDSALELRGPGDVVGASAVLTDFSPGASFTDVGQSGTPTIPTPLTVQISNVVATDTVVTVTSDTPASLTVVGGGVTIPAGQTSAPVLVNGLAQAASVTLTATLGTVSLTATVRVVGAGEQPALASLSPTSVNVSPATSTTFTVALDIPAPAAGVTVALALAPANAGTIPATVVVPANATSATFPFTDTLTTGSATITATLGAVSQQATLTAVSATAGLMINEIDYDQPGSGADSAEFVEIYNSGAAPVSLTGYSLLLVNGANSAVYQTVPLGPAGTLLSDQYLVVGATSVVSSLPANTLKIDLGAVTNYIQNGSPDGVALVDTTHEVLVDALSYEGAITAAVIPGLGTVSLVEGTVLPASVADSNTAAASLCRLPDGTDTNDAANDWKLSGTPTPGAPNVP
ncbi:MAG TPA: lamin tail domain-containing protein [Polyangiaceae bacterium]|jgi:hypothetical protein